MTLNKLDKNFSNKTAYRKIGKESFFKNFDYDKKGCFYSHGAKRDHPQTIVDKKKEKKSLTSTIASLSDEAAIPKTPKTFFQPDRILA